MSLRFTNLYSPNDAVGTGTADVTTGLGKEEVIELLGDDNEQETLDLTTPPKTTKEKTDETGDDEEETDKPEEIDELKEIEEELEGPSDEDLELMTPVRRREILKKYPQLFKDFPYLEKAYYREQQFTELLPTIQDAKIAVEKARALDVFDRQVMNGDIAGVLEAVRDENKEAFYRIADNYLPMLRKADEGAYYHVIGTVVKDAIATMAREGRNLGDNGQPLLAAAQIVNQFMFGSNQFEPPKKLSKDTRPEDKGKENELREQQQQIVMERFESSRDDLQTKTDNVLKATIDGHIDPKKSMTDYVRSTAAEKALQMLEDLMSKDARFQNLKDRLWEKAFEDKFSKESTDRIKSAYLSKAKTLLPSVIKKARNDALRGLGKRVREEDDTEDTPPRRGPILGSKTADQTRSGKIKKPSDIPRGMKTIDVLMQD